MRTLKRLPQCNWFASHACFLHKWRNCESPQWPYSHACRHTSTTIHLKTFQLNPDPPTTLSYKTSSSSSNKIDNPLHNGLLKNQTNSIRRPPWFLRCCRGWLLEVDAVVRKSRFRRTGRVGRRIDGKSMWWMEKDRAWRLMACGYWLCVVMMELRGDGFASWSWQVRWREWQSGRHSHRPKLWISLLRFRHLILHAPLTCTSIPSIHMHMHMHIHISITYMHGSLFLIGHLRCACVIRLVFLLLHLLFIRSYVFNVLLHYQIHDETWFNES